MKSHSQFPIFISILISVTPIAFAQSFNFSFINTKALLAAGWSRQELSLLGGFEGLCLFLGGMLLSVIIRQIFESSTNNWKGNETATSTATSEIQGSVDIMNHKTSNQSQIYVGNEWETLAKYWPQIKLQADQLGAFDAETADWFRAEMLAIKSETLGDVVFSSAVDRLSAKALNQSEEAREVTGLLIKNKMAAEFRELRKLADTVDIHGRLSDIISMVFEAQGVTKEKKSHFFFALNELKKRRADDQRERERKTKRDLLLAVVIIGAIVVFVILYRI